MPTSEIFRMDDFLIKGAVYLGAAFLVVLAACGLLILFDGVSGAGPASSRLGLALAGFALAPVGMGVVGFRLRRRETRALTLRKLIHREVEISADDLLGQSDWTPADLDRAVRDLNNTASAYVVWDRRSGLVQDGRLRRSSLVVDECGACGGKLAIQVAIGEAGLVRCPYCDEPIDTALIAEEKARMIDELEADRPNAASMNSPTEAQGEFSLVVFALLFAAFWPAGLWYCWRHRGTIADLVD